MVNILDTTIMVGRVSWEGGYNNEVVKFAYPQMLADSLSEQ